MVDVLIRMKIAILRHSMTGERAGWVVTGGIVGLVFGGATIWLSTAHDADSAVLLDLLAIAFTMWTLGWLVGPVWGGESVLHPDHFSLLPIPRTRLAIGLLAAAFVGVTTAVTLVGFTGLIVYGARLGVVAAVVAVPAVVLQLAFVVLLSRVATTIFSTVTRSRLGGVIIAVLTAGMMVVTQWGWLLIVAVNESGVLDGGFPPGLSAVVRALPSSWGVVAVGAAARSDWVVTTTALVGLAVLIGLLLVAWSRLLGMRRSARAIVRGSSGRPASRGPALATPTGAVFVKELRTWWRDPNRTQSLVIGPAFALMLGVLPLTFGEEGVLPWAGAVAAFMTITLCGNLYAQDGTALWLTILSPGAERADIRGRQWAWLAAFGPVTLVMSIMLTAVSGLSWAWPWVLAILPSLIGGGVGLTVAFAVAQLVPGPDPHRNRTSPMDHGDGTGPGFALFFISLLLPVPALALLVPGTLLDDPLLQWAAVPVGVAFGGFLAWWLGRVAYRRLRARGPELLQLMRTGHSIGGGATAVARPGFLDTMDPSERKAALTTLIAGSIALLPQGLVPMGIKLDGSDSKVWFLALYLPDDWQWPVIAVMIAIGLTLYAVVIRIVLRTMRRNAAERTSASTTAGG